MFRSNQCVALLLCVGLMMVLGCGRQDISQHAVSEPATTPQPEQEATTPQTPQTAVSSGPASYIDKAVPAFSFPLVHGKDINHLNTKGQVVLLDFWATWCGPCRQLSPVMQSLHDTFSDQGLLIVGVNTWERDASGKPVQSPEYGRNYARKHGYDYAFAYAGDAFADQLEMEGIPTMMLIDRDGIVRDVIAGYHPAIEKILTQKITPLLASRE